MIIVKKIIPGDSKQDPGNKKTPVATTKATCCRSLDKSPFVRTHQTIKIDNIRKNDTLIMIEKRDVLNTLTGLMPGNAALRKYANRAADVIRLHRLVRASSSVACVFSVPHSGQMTPDSQTESSYPHIEHLDEEVVTLDTASTSRGLVVVTAHAGCPFRWAVEYRSKYLHGNAVRVCELQAVKSS